MSPSEPSPFPVTDELQGSAVASWALLRTSLAALFKIRVVALLLLAAVGGAFLAAGGWPGIADLLLLLVAGGLVASGASAINQYLERELDARMERTRGRPLAVGSFRRTGWVPYAGGAMILVPSLVVFPFKPPLSFFLLLGSVIYIGIYTLWLKPRTPLNIVIGGAAGSVAVLSGSAAVGEWNDPGALLLALLVFLWTPTHFWSLAIAYRADYARGGFPMLPVQTTPRAAAWWVLLNTSGAALVGLALATIPALGWLYLLPVGLSGLFLLVLNVRLIAGPSRSGALVLFHASNLYLALVLLLICVDTLVH